MLRAKIFLFSFSILLYVLNPHALFSQEWLGNKIGINNNVPTPWTPLKIKSGTNQTYTVSCWGRDYFFSGNSLMEQTISQNEPIFQSPVKLKYNNNSNWIPIASKIIKNEPTIIQLEFLSKLNQTGTEIKNKTTITIHYDGVIFFQNEISSRSKLNGRIQMTISLKENSAKNIHRAVKEEKDLPQKRVSDFFPESDQTSFVPFIWVGNWERGLFWFAESPFNWLNYKKDNAIVFSKNRQNNSADITFNLIDKNSINSNTWTFEFGLQSTPVRAMTENWRSWQLWGIPEGNLQIVWPDAGTDRETKFFGYPEARNQRNFNSEVKRIQTSNRKALLYNALTYFSSAAPEWATFKNKWDIQGITDRTAPVVAYAGEYSNINITDPDFQDFIIWKSDKFLRETNSDGYYLDLAMIGNLNAHKKVKTFKGVAENLPYYPIMEYRKIHERFYKMVKSHGKNKLLISHSWFITTPFLGYSDALVNGEQYRQFGTKVKGDYLELTSLQSFQSEFSGKQFGFPIIFLPVLEAPYYKTIYPTRYLAAILLQHDVLVWPSNSVFVVWSERYKLLTGFAGYQQAEFIPYYSDNRILISPNNTVIGSVYKNSRGDYLCIVSNLDNKPFSGNIIFSDKNTSLSNFVLSPKNGRNISRIKTENSIAVNIEKQDYAAFYLLRK